MTHLLMHSRCLISYLHFLSNVRTCFCRIRYLTNRFVDSHLRRETEKVLRSDSKRFNEEFAAAEKDSQEDVVEKWKSLVRERWKVGDCPVH